MFFLRFLRVVITIVLVAFLLMSGFIALFTYSVDRVILTTDYFSEYLLDSGAYSSAYNYLLDEYAPIEQKDEESEIEGADLAIGLVFRSVDSTVLANVTADYLSGWMEYFLSEVSVDEIPELDIVKLSNSIYDAAISLADDEDFMLTLLGDTLEEQGQSMDDYTYEEQLALLEDLQIKELYISTVDEELNGEFALFNVAETEQDPLAVLKYASPELSEEEILENVHNTYGKLEYYKSIIYVAFAVILVCLVIIFILWLNKLNVGFILNGIVIFLSALPLLILSLSKKTFNFIANTLAAYTFDFDYMIENIDFYNNVAVKPIVNQMIMTSVVAASIGILFIIISAILAKRNKSEKRRHMP